jgi:dipeptidyl aminopeptidase/acylaminoacyl peptidase
MPASTARSRSTSRRRIRSKRVVMPDDLERIVFVGSPQISPDGDRIVFVHKRVGEKNEYATNLWMADADGDEPPRVFTGGGKDTQPRWSPDGEQIAFVRKNGETPAQIHLIPAAGGEAEPLTRLPEGSIGAIKWSPDGSTIAMSFREQAPEWTNAARKEREESGASDPPRVLDDWWYRLDGDGYFNAQRYKLCLVDVATGDHRVVYAKDTLGFFAFDWAPDGRRIAIATNRDRKAMVKAWKDEIVILNVSTGRLTPVPGLPDGPKTAVAWSPDGKRLAYGGRVGTDDIYSVENLEVYTCDPARGGARSLTGKTDYCLMAITASDAAEMEFGATLRWSHDSRRVYMKLGWHGESHLASVAARGGKVVFHTKGAADFDIGNLSHDGTRVALTRATIDRPAEVFVGERTGDAFRPRAVTDLNRGLLRELMLSKVTSHTVRTPDGTTVQTWVMLPPGHAAGSRKRYPAVLQIHGGPHAQYGVGFFHEMQVLAGQGYAVLFSNPRGSKGYGRDHCAAIRGRWGTDDWTDMQAVIAFMKDHPNVDAKRMGVMGGSYGGYMTNWIIGHTREFAGAITDRCVSNMVTMGGTSDFVVPPDQYFPGNFWDRPEARWEQSPMRFIGRAKTPTLIIHSEGDLRCNVEQAEQLFTALKLLNVPTRFVRYPRNTSHGLSRCGPPDMRLHRLDQILGWWERWLKRK